MKILAAQPIEPTGSETLLTNPIVHQPLLEISAGEHDTERTTPGVVMQTTIGITVEESVDVGSAATRQPKKVIALEVRLSVVAVNDAATQPAREPEK